MNDHTWARIALRKMLLRCKAWAAADLEAQAKALAEAAKGLRE